MRSVCPSTWISLIEENSLSRATTSLSSCARASGVSTALSKAKRPVDDTASVFGAGGAAAGGGGGGGGGAAAGLGAGGKHTSRGMRSTSHSQWASAGVQ